LGHPIGDFGRTKIHRRVRLHPRDIQCAMSSMKSGAWAISCGLGNAPCQCF
jgi:hypothetical protein